MRRLQALFVVAIAMAWMTGGHAHADQLPSCAIPAGTASRVFPNEMPLTLQNALKDKVGDVAAPGEPFDSTDVVVTGRNRRAIFVWERGRRWVVATEHGGRGYNDPVLAFDLSPDGVSVTLVAVRTAFPQTLCSTAHELLDVR
ncbi:MAG TPA: hypothetical protein VEK73_11090 [Xanthobacteraceae bacterium]|nr:hypothetical protein [Xanthobacteraceae bacterium]